MRQIIETLNKIVGQNVVIYTDHKLFGKQHIEMQFVPETEIGIGFQCKEQSIYIDKDDVIDYEISDSDIVINGKLMCIHIRLCGK